MKKLTEQEVEFLAKFRSKIEFNRYNINALLQINKDLNEIAGSVSVECLHFIEKQVAGLFGFDNDFTVPETVKHPATEYIIKRD